MKKIIVLVLSLASLYSYAQQKPKAPQQKETEKPYTCVAGPDEQCPSDLWWAEYQKYRVLEKKYTPPQEVADQMSGMALRLAKQIPDGFIVSDEKKRWVKKSPQIQNQPEVPQTKATPTQPK